MFLLFSPVLVKTEGVSSAYTILNACIVRGKFVTNLFKTLKAKVFDPL